MSQPVVVTIPHKLGKDEAKRRLQSGFTNMRSSFGETFVVLKDSWRGEHLDFEASLVLRGQGALDTLDLTSELLESSLVAGQVGVVSLLEHLDEVLHHTLVEVLASHVGVTVGGQHLDGRKV